MKIIGFLGKKGSGKDTCSDYITSYLSNLNITSEKVAFANPLKKATQILFQLTDDQVYGSQKEVIDDNWKITPRQIFQYIGTDIFRNKIDELIPNTGSNFWCKSFEKSLQNINVEYILVSDVRFQNEVDIIHKLGGIIIKIERDLINEKFNEHISELSIDEITNYDHIIVNNSSLINLHKSLDELCLNIFLNL